MTDTAMPTVGDVIPIPAGGELARLRAEMATAGAHAIVLGSMAAVTYATGWEVPIPLGALADLSGGEPTLIASREGAVLVVPDGLADAARAAAAVDEVVPFATFDGITPIDSADAYWAAIEGAVYQLCGKRNHGTIALEIGAVSAAAADMVLSTLPGWESSDAALPLARARAIKTPREIALLRRAAAVADAAHNALIDACQTAGKTEFELWAAVAVAAFAAAGRDIPLTGEIVSGPRTTTVAYPNGPRARVTEPGDPVLMDLSGRVDGYWFDCTNTLLVGRAETTVNQVRHARASQAACEAAMDALRPGAVAADAAAAAAAAFARFDLPMAHYAGHQIGASVNELPRLVPYDQTPIEAGMVFSVEPGAYEGPGGSFGARSEKMVLVTEDGPEVLSTFNWGI